MRMSAEPTHRGNQPSVGCVPLADIFGRDAGLKKNCARFSTFSISFATGVPVWGVSRHISARCTDIRFGGDSVHLIVRPDWESRPPAPSSDITNQSLPYPNNAECLAKKQEV